MSYGDIWPSCHKMSYFTALIISGTFVAGPIRVDTIWKEIH